MAPQEHEDEGLISHLVAMLKAHPRPDYTVVARWKGLHPDDADAIDRQIAFRRRREQPLIAALSKEADDLLTSFTLAMGDQPPTDDMIGEWVVRHPEHEADLGEFAEAARHVASTTGEATDEEATEAEVHGDLLTKTRMIDLEVEARLKGRGLS